MVLTSRAGLLSTNSLYTMNLDHRFVPISYFLKGIMIMIRATFNNNSSIENCKFVIRNMNFEMPERPANKYPLAIQIFIPPFP